MLGRWAAELVSTFPEVPRREPEDSDWVGDTVEEETPAAVVAAVEVVGK